MGLVKSIKFSNLIADELFRLDSKFHFLNNEYGWNIFNSQSDNLITLNKVLIPYYESFIYHDNKEYKGIPTGMSYLDDFGEIISFLLVTKENHPNRLKYKINNDCILISSLKGARTPALQFDFNLEEYVFSNGFYIFKVSKNWNKKFILNLLRTVRLKEVLDNNIYRGIGISSYRAEDLLKVKIPNISLAIQNYIVKKIELIEEEIRTLKKRRLNSLQIINKSFAKHFNINLDEVEKLENIKQFNLPLRLTSLKNNTFRTSYKWHKLETIQSYIYKDIDCIEKLDKFIVSMNNGWSPESSEVEDGTPILGQEHIRKNGKISLNPAKFTTKSKSNIENFYVKQNDFFVSRGNTVELVALASIVTDEVEENILYPDLYIRVDFDNKYVNKQYMAFLFNSFIGRIYFGHVAKGKNQTMVKVSSKELYDFYLPLPTLEVQKQIVIKIETEIEAQQNIDNQIEAQQLEISRLIEESIKESSND